MKQKLILGQKAIGAALVVAAGATVISSAIAFTSFATSSAATLAVVGEAANSSQDMRTLQIVERLTGDEREHVLTQYGFHSITELSQKIEKRRIAAYSTQREHPFQGKVNRDSTAKRTRIPRHREQTERSDAGPLPFYSDCGFAVNRLRVLRSDSPASVMR